jgi:hypothetical protein
MKRTAVTANNHALREMLRNSGDTRIQTSGSRNTAVRGAVAGTDHYVTRVLAPPLHGTTGTRERCHPLERKGQIIAQRLLDWQPVLLEK